MNISQNVYAPPLAPHTLYILLALSQGEMHAYAIQGEIAKLSAGSVIPNRKTVSNTLKRLEQRGLIRPLTGYPRPHGRRATYNMSMGGRNVLQDELRRLERIVHLGRWYARRRLG